MSQTTYIAIGKAINRLRADKSLSLEDLSSLSGVSASQLKAIEDGAHRASITQIHAIAQALEISIQNLLEKSYESKRVR